MILVDTSVWVDFLRGTDTPARSAVRELISRRFDELVICEPIVMELMAGATDPVALDRIQQLADGLPTLHVDPLLDFRAAAALYRLARSGGETVRSIVDCLIAAVALRHDVRLVHKDHDFEVLGRITGLRHRSYRSA
jgi:predicted nucleic acid-binding protein